MSSLQGRDGIKYARDTHHTGCGMACQVAGKVSKTIPFDKIMDCNIGEPAGATCGYMNKVLTVVSVDTASSGGVNPQFGIRTPELTLAGLKDPDGLKKLVWAMKRVTAGGQMGPSIKSAPLLYAGVMDRGFGNNDTNAILCDIQEELKVLNANMKNFIEYTRMFHLQGYFASLVIMFVAKFFCLTSGFQSKQAS